VFAGILKISGTSAPELDVTVEAAVDCEWLYPGKSARLPDDAFHATLAAYGAYYNKSADIQTGYAGASFEIQDLGWTLPLIPGTGGALIVATNPDKLTVKAVRNTGLFSGSFKVLNSATGRTVTLKHVGVLTRQNSAYVGDGAYIESSKTGNYTLKTSHRVKIVP
jgi:hypothetical protein